MTELENRLIKCLAGSNNGLTWRSCGEQINSNAANALKSN